MLLRMLPFAVLLGACCSGTTTVRDTVPEGVLRTVSPPAATIVAVVDPDLRAVLSDLTALTYAGGANVAEDLPGHVRAASAIRRSGSRLLIIQDDTNALAWLDAEGQVTGTLLPRGEGGRRVFDDSLGNRSAKLDLEACVALPDGRLVAFGSGATPYRERLVVVSSDGSAELRDAPDLYAQFRSTPEFAGSELNLEGAVVVGDRIRFFQRGNGAPVGALRPINAIGDVALDPFLDWLDRSGPLPSFELIVEVDLGGSGSVRFSFSDAVEMHDGRIAFLACAEASPDAIADGEVAGCRFGILDGETIRIADIIEDTGTVTRLKLEGIEAHTDPFSFHVVSDMDRPDEPAQHGLLRIAERAAR